MDNFEKHWAIKFYRIFMVLGVTAGPLFCYLYIGNVVRKEMEPVEGKLETMRRTFVAFERYDRDFNDLSARVVVLERATEQKLDKIVAEQRDVNREMKTQLDKFGDQIHSVDTKLQILDALGRAIQEGNKTKK